MTPGLRTFGVMYNHIFFLNLQFTISDIRPHIKLAVRLVIAYGHFALPQVFVCMYGLCGYALTKFKVMLNVCCTRLTFSINSYLVSAFWLIIVKTIYLYACSTIKRGIKRLTRYCI